MYKDDYKIKKRLSTKKWRENNPEKVKEYRKLYEQIEKVKKYRQEYRKTKGPKNAKQWRDKNPDRARSVSLMYSYGISIEQYNQIFVDQNGVCLICGGKEPNGRSLCVDHNHETGQIRGLLCRACNSGLGHFKENVDSLNNAIIYLNKFK